MLVLPNYLVSFILTALAKNIDRNLWYFFKYFFSRKVVCQIFYHGAHRLLAGSHLRVLRRHLFYFSE